jgi:hypothetical protein
MAACSSSIAWPEEVRGFCATGINQRFGAAAPLLTVLRLTLRLAFVPADAGATSTDGRLYVVSAPGNQASAFDFVH